MNTVKAALQHYKRKIIWILSIIIIYTLIGFYFIPWIAEKQLVSLIQQRLNVQASVNKIAFNPYTFEISIDRLAIITNSNEPLVAWEKLYLNIEPIELVKLNLTIDDLSIVSPKLHFHRYSETENTLTKLAQTWNQTANTNAQQEHSDIEADVEQKSPLLTFNLRHFNYTQGELNYRDDVPEGSFTTVLSPINIHLVDFSTQPGQAATNDLIIDLEDDAELKLNGNLVLSPLHLDGRISLNNFSLETPYRYLQANLPFELKDGRLALNLAYEIDVNGSDTGIDLTKIDLELADFSINQVGQTASLLNGGRLKLNNGNFSYPENKLSLENVLLEGFKFVATQDKQGQLNWLEMINNLPKSQADTAQKDNNEKGLELDITNISLSNTRIELEDQTPDKPVHLSLNLAANLQNFNLLTESRMPFTTNINLESGGSIDLKGDIQLFPNLALTTTANVEQLSLLPVQPYLDQYAYIDLINGSVDLSTTITTDQQEPFGLKGNLALTGMQLDNKKLNEKLLSLDQLALNNIDISLSKQSLNISEVIVDKLYSRVKVTNKGETNVGLLLKQQPEIENKQQPAKTEASKDYELAIGRIKLNDASSQYTDENLPIVFNANIHKLNGELSGFSTRSKQPVEIALEGQVDEFGLVEINGSINPLDIANQTSINLAFTNLDLPSVSPYTIKFAGREIAEGSGDFQMTYDVIENELNATNKVVIKNILLGERVESPEALDLPLDLAIALLKNSDGVIDLSIPVTGNVNDPQFSMGPVIRGAIANAIRNIVTAPFRFLASLLGESEESIKDIQFRAGRSVLSPPEQEKLIKLVAALKQRPQLALKIPAPFDQKNDRQSLKIKAVEQRIETSLKDTDPEQQLVARTQAVLERLYTESTLTPDIATIKQEVIEASKTPENADPDLDVLAYNQNIKTRLIQAQPITDSELSNLGIARQTSVVEFIKGLDQLNQTQLQKGDIVSIEFEDGWIVMPFKLNAVMPN